jgi:hypothetical protein
MLLIKKSKTVRVAKYCLRLKEVNAVLAFVCQGFLLIPDEEH